MPPCLPPTEEGWVGGRTEGYRRTIANNEQSCRDLNIRPPTECYA